MAPSQDEWDSLDPNERQEVLDQLPPEVTDAEAMPEGDRHFKAKVRALDTLRSYFERTRRRIYLASELPTYYPRAPRFAPDVLAVLDVDAHDRDKWVVSAEGKGLDWVLEVHVGGDRKKDTQTNVVRYARLGIPEYFIYDRQRERLLGYRLPDPQARVYSPIIPQLGVYQSDVLGMGLQVEGERLRFFSGTALLLETDELINRLQRMLEQVQLRVEEESRLREEESRLREEESRLREEAERGRQEESRRREEAERELAALRAELERLKVKGP